MEYPLVSVVIPIYNMQEYLEETLQSVVKSTYPNLEVILMDDGSKDHSAQIARQYADRYACFHYFYQENQGLSATRNHAISRANGVYIYPLDADDLLHPDFLTAAVDVMMANPNVKVVCSTDLFFGARQGKWSLPDFSLSLLARKNIIAASALYRKSDWAKAGGYCADMVWKEDWDFWISILKSGGDVVRLPQPGISYRIRSGSIRVSKRKLKEKMIRLLNKRHGAFFQQQLNGPLRKQRTWSKLFNTLVAPFSARKLEVNPDFQEYASFIYDLPVLFDQQGEVIYEGRNKLKRFRKGDTSFIVKSFQRPILINRIIYGLLRASKAERAYLYALKFLKSGIGTPVPVGFLTVRRNCLLAESYFISLESTCNFQFSDFKKQQFVHEKEILEAIGVTTAKMHEQGFLHKDYSAGNILFRDELPVPVEIIDLNRMRFHPIGLSVGCKNFERLSGSEQMFSVIGKAYARERKMNEQECVSLIQKFHE